MTVAHVLSISCFWLGSDVPAVEHERPAVVAEDSFELTGRNFKARVIRVEPKERRLIVRLRWRGVKTFEVADDATITRNGNPVKLGRLRRNDQLRLRTKPYPGGPKVFVLHAWMPL